MMTPRATPLALPSWRALATIAAIWLVIACVFVGQQALGGGSGSGSDSLTWQAPARVFIYNALWALVTVGLLTLVRYTRRDDDRVTVTMVATHALLGIAAAGLVTAVYWTIGNATGVAEPIALGELLVSNLLIATIIYWTILGAILLVEGSRHARERRAATDTLERLLLDARAAMLRAQLRPHFLFNTLNSIAGLIAAEPARAEAMVVRLGDLLRLALDDRRGALVTLHEEMIIADSYLAIEQLRLGERLRIERHIAPDTLRARLPDLLLQPLIENAIRHGLSPLPNGGLLRIEATRDRDAVRIAVTDDGLGGDRDAMQMGVGLRSTCERVTAAGGVIQIDTSPGAGFSVTVRLPDKAA